MNRFDFPEKESPVMFVNSRTGTVYVWDTVDVWVINPMGECYSSLVHDFETLCDYLTGPDSHWDFCYV